MLLCTFLRYFDFALHITTRLSLFMFLLMLKMEVDVSKTVRGIPFEPTSHPTLWLIRVDRTDPPVFVLGRVGREEVPPLVPGRPHVRRVH